MATLNEAVERARNDARPTPVGDVGVRELDGLFKPTPRGSVRALLDTMYDGARSLPFAVILCRFRGEPAAPVREQPIEQFYRRAFTSGTGGLVEYWRDVSLGKVDISASRVFGWIEVDVSRSAANTGSGATRATLVEAAIRAVRNAGGDPVTGFHTQLSVYLENWSTNGVPPGLDWSDATWGSLWIDGGFDGSRISLTPPHNGNVVAHEMGHAFGMSHDVGPDLVTEYGDPCCIMSQQHSYIPASWGVSFGPSLCVPHLVQAGWMYPRRILTQGAGWMARPSGASFPLAPLTDPGARGNLGIRLALSRDAEAAWDYFIEYVRPTYWNVGLGGPTVIIRRMAPHFGGQTPAHLGSIPVPATPGVTAEFLEPAGRVRFTVERFEDDGRALKIGARKL